MINNPIENRNIRVFISSTFQDMQNERDYLMQRTFPKLRDLASERNVMLTEVDLRWGITEEEANSGNVVDVCLREIENSIPFFIGIIGNRYGWVPSDSDINTDTKERFPDVNSYLKDGLSVTEMEMQFGVLKREEDLNAFFYIKEQQGESDNPKMLEHLKQEVVASRYPSSTYVSKEDLADQVEKAFVNLLDEYFPEQKFTGHDLIRFKQQSILNQYRQFYIKNNQYHQLLDEWLQKKEEPFMVVSGDCGSGKSTLVANWLKDNEQVNDYHVIYYAFDNNLSLNNGKEGISSYQKTCQYLSDEICSLYSISNKKFIGNKDEGTLLELFSQVAIAEKPLLIVLDGVDKMEDGENNAKLLWWMPCPIMSVKIIYTTIEGDKTFEVLNSRDYPKCSMRPFSIQDRKQFIEEYLQQYAKKITVAQVDRIANDTQCEYPLVIRTLLDELINFGSYEKLDERIEFYLHAEGIDAFYQSVLESYEQNFADFGDEFVKKIFSLIVLSHHGLSEQEIMEMVGIKPLQWSQFYCAVKQNFIDNSGFISIRNPYMQDAINKRFLAEDWDNPDRDSYELFHWRYQCEKDLISYFESHKTIRGKIEILYQCMRHGYYAEKIIPILLDVDVLNYLYINDVQFLHKCISWYQMESEESFPFDLYIAAVNENIESTFETLMSLVKFLNNGITVDEPLVALQILEQIGTKKLTNQQRIELLLDKAAIFSRLGQVSKRIKCLYNALRISEKNKINEPQQYLSCLDELCIAHDERNSKTFALRYADKLITATKAIYGAYSLDYVDSLLVIAELDDIKENSIFNLKKALAYLNKVECAEIEINARKMYIHERIGCNYALMGGKLPIPKQYRDLAKNHFNKALKISLLTYGEYSIKSARLLKCMSDYGGFCQQEKCNLKALEIVGKLLPNSLEYAEMLRHIANFYWMNDIEKSIEYCREAVEITKSIIFKDDVGKDYLIDLYEEYTDYLKSNISWCDLRASYCFQSYNLYASKTHVDEEILMNKKSQVDELVEEYKEEGIWDNLLQSMYNHWILNVNDNEL